jgi:hypothetical protein
VSTPSWRRVPYGTRPAKHAERKMIAEALARLDALHPLPDWRYIGLGSLWFTDFSLFHRRLGLNNLHSIEDEQSPDLQARFQRNAPFAATLHFGKTTTELPQMPWDGPAIVWLDYDDPFQDWMLEDLDHVVSLCLPPTMLIVTVNVHPGLEEGRRERFIAGLPSSERLPHWAKTDADLGHESSRRGWANGVREVFGDQISAALLDRGEPGLAYEQVFHFRYADGAPMATFGGLIAGTGSGGACNFANLRYYRAGDRAFSIKPPVVTLREGLALEAMLPDDPASRVQLRGIDPTEVKAFRELYRYLPAFADVDL